MGKSSCSGAGVPRDSRVKDEAGNIFLGHSWQLVGKDILQSHKPEQHTPVDLGSQRVANDVEFDDPSPFFQASRFISSCVG